MNLPRAPGSGVKSPRLLKENKYFSLLFGIPNFLAKLGVLAGSVVKYAPKG